jgi:hypothetical protein
VQRVNCGHWAVVAGLHACGRCTQRRTGVSALHVRGFAQLIDCPGDLIFCDYGGRS